MQKPHNNQELFANYYLKERLPDRDAWQEPKGLAKVYEKISDLYVERKDILESTKEAQTEEEWIKPVLKILGFSYITQPSESIFDTTKVPDYAFFLNDEDKRKAYKVAEDNKEDLFNFALAVGDAKRWDRNLNELRPNKQIDEYLRITNSKWGILTNGRLWRLYHLDSSYRLDTYYEINLVELIEAEDKEKFKYFYLFFQPSSFVEDGFLTEVYERSEDFTASVTEDLKENAFDALRELCQGFLSGNPELGEEDLDDIYENSLVLLYRLIFLLYAESEEEENLLPMDNEKYRKSHSLEALKKKVIEKKKNNESLLSSSHRYWEWLRELFSFIDQGEETLGVFEYNGGLFGSKKHRFLDEKYTIGNKYVAEAIQKVSYSEAEGGFIDYQDLDVRELGAIYEGLLEHKPVVEEEQVKWEEDLSERKKTGSYYTPEYIVKYIVENTIEPLVEEKKDEIEEEINELRKKLKGSKGYNREAYQHKLEEKRQELREEILDLKVLDPAMGSGHFLVEATEKLANSIASLEEEFSSENKQESMPGGENIEKKDNVKELKRQIVESSIYGVDKNPLATELAKLSLWLHTVAKGKPLSFLDHHLRTGDSLIGIGIEKMKTMPSEREQMAGLFTTNLVQDLGNAIGNLNLIEKTASGSREDVQEKKKEWRGVRSWVDKYKKAANVRLSTGFGNEINADEYRAVLQAAARDNIERVKNKQFFQKGQEVAENKSFFHWELEFPDVFRDKDGEKKDKAGFDVVIGNPPYVAFSRLNNDYRDYLESYETGSGYKPDLFMLFQEKSISICREGGFASQIIPNRFFLTKPGRGLRDLLSQYDISEIVDFGLSKVFKDALNYVCIPKIKKSNNKENFIYKKSEAKMTVTDQYTCPKEYLERELWYFPNENMVSIQNKIEKKSMRAESYIRDMFAGIQTGNDELFTANKPPKGEEDIYSRFLRSKDIFRYSTNKESEFLIFPYDEDGILDESRLKEGYSKTYQQLRSNKEVLMKRVWHQEDPIERSGEWYGLMYVPDAEKFFKNKIICPYLAQKNVFLFDKENQIFGAGAGYGILTEPENDNFKKLLTGILNSKVIFYEFTLLSPEFQSGFKYNERYVSKLPVPADLDELKPTKEDQIASLVDGITHKINARGKINLNLLDYLGNYDSGPSLSRLYEPMEGISELTLMETTKTKDNLRIGQVAFKEKSSDLIMEVSVRYKPEENDKIDDIDKWGYVETELEPVMRFSVNENLKSLIKEFVPLAVDKGSGFANFRETAAKTISPIERLEKLTIPKLGDVEGALEKYLEQKEKAKKLEREIQETDHQINAIVFDLYDLNEDEVRTVLNSLETPEEEKSDILKRFRQVG